MAAAERPRWALRAVLNERAATGTLPVDRACEPAGARGRGAAAGPFFRPAPSATWCCLPSTTAALAGRAAQRTGRPCRRVPRTGTFWTGLPRAGPAAFSPPRRLYLLRRNAPQPTYVFQSSCCAWRRTCAGAAADNHDA